MHGEGDSDGSSVNRRSFLKVTGAAGAAGLTGLSGCIGGLTGGGGGGSGPITFGQPALLSGDLQFIQPPVSAASDLARQKINEAGGPLGRELNLRRRDTGRDPATARQVLDQHVNQDNAAVVNGFTSTVTVPMWQRIQETQVPIVSMFAGSRFLDSRGGDGNTPDDLSDDGWFWRTTGADSQHTAAAAVHAQREGATTVGVINQKAAGARTWANAFLDGARVLDGVEVVNQVEVSAGKASYRSDLDSFFSDDIDLWGLAIDANSAVSIMRQWKEGGYGGKVMLSNPLKNSQIREQLGGEMADEWVRVSVPAIAGPYASQYRSQFNDFVSNNDSYESGLGQNNWSASAYDAITVSALAVHRAGEVDHEAIQRNIGKVARPPGTKVSTFQEGKEALDNGDDIDYVGAQTTVDFNEYGDVFNLAEISELGADGFSVVDEVTGDRIQEVISQVRQLSDSS